MSCGGMGDLVPAPAPGCGPGTGVRDLEQPRSGSGHPVARWELHTGTCTGVGAQQQPKVSRAGVGSSRTSTCTGMRIQDPEVLCRAGMGHPHPNSRTGMGTRYSNGVSCFVMGDPMTAPVLEWRSPTGTHAGMGTCTGMGVSHTSTPTGTGVRSWEGAALLAPVPGWRNPDWDGRPGLELGSLCWEGIGTWWGSHTGTHTEGGLGGPTLVPVPGKG